MRVSTAQFYFENSLNISTKQSDVNEQIQYISSGKRVLTAKDDSVAYGTLTGYKDELGLIEKYTRNITQAENRNSLVETSFANAESILQEFKQTFIQANNGTLSDEDLNSLADLGENALEQMLDIANTKDETGGYIFSGYNINVEPFKVQPDNSVNYLGDNGERELQIAKNVLVKTNISGDKAFMFAGNPKGDFSPTYNVNNSGISVKNAVIKDPSLYDDTLTPLNFSFASPTDLTVTDSGGTTLYTTAAYSPGQVVPLTNGVEVQIDGNPLPGDDFDLAEVSDISVFESIKTALDWMRVGANPADPIQHEVDYGDILSQIDGALNHVTAQRSQAGIRLQLIDTQDNNNMDAELQLEKARSNIEDLDFAKAVSAFEQSQVALQAAQQTFAQVKNLSLFNYI